MHWSGKVFAWLLVPLMLAAMVLSAKLVKVRNGWAARIIKQKAEYGKLAEDLRAKQLEADRAFGDWHRATQFWGPFAEAATNVQNPAAGTLTVALGTTHTLRQNQRLYGFEILADGSAVYRGDFVAQVVREGESSLAPIWRVRPGDTVGWQGGKWRWRLHLPASYPTRFDELTQALLLQDELAADRQKTLADQETLIEAAQTQLKFREAELVGGPELPQEEALEQEFREGLVAALEAVEEERNAQLVAIDRLRRSVRNLRSRIEATQAENRELAGKLPQPAAEITRKP